MAYHGDPLFMGIATIRNGGKIQTEAGTAIITVSATGEVSVAIEDIDLTGDVVLGSDSADTVTINSTSTFNAPVTSGADDTGHDWTWYTATAGSRVYIDESADEIVFRNVSASGAAVNDGATGYQFIAYHLSASPAANDKPGSYLAVGRSDGGNDVVYGAFSGIIVDATDGAEFGGVVLEGQINGSSADLFAMYSDGSECVLGSAVPDADLSLSTDGSGIITTTPILNVLKNATATAGGAEAIRVGTGASGVAGIYFGSGAPTIAAPQGSLYLRTDGSSTSTRMYVNTDGSTTWTNVVTAA